MEDDWKSYFQSSRLPFEILLNLVLEDQYVWRNIETYRPVYTKLYPEGREILLAPT